MNADVGSRFPATHGGNRLPRSVYALWLLFALFIVYGGTIPFRFAGDVGLVMDKLRDLPVNPFISPDTGRRLSIPDVVQNLLLYVPFGALGFLAGDGARALRRIGVVTALGLVLSTFVEGLQLMTYDRVASLGDVVSNGAGACLGGVAAWQLHGLGSAGLRRLRSEGMAEVDEFRPFAIATIALLIAAWQPFDVTLEVGSVVSKLRAIQIDVWQFAGLRDEGLAVMMSAIFTMTLAGYLSALGERRAGRKSAATAVGLVFMLEASQVLIGSRMPSLWDAVIASTGVLIGASMWTIAERVIWPRLWLTVLVISTSGAAALLMLSPFEVAPGYRGFGWFPFLGYYTRTTFETLSHVIELALLYFPLGFGLSWLKGNSRQALATGVVAVLAIAIPVEYAQGWIVGRYPDITDAAIGLIGVWAGIHAYNRRRA